MNNSAPVGPLAVMEDVVLANGLHRVQLRQEGQVPDIRCGHEAIRAVGRPEAVLCGLDGRKGHRSRLPGVEGIQTYTTAGVRGLRGAQEKAFEREECAYVAARK